MLLKARTIRSGVALGPHRIAAQRPSVLAGPTKLYTAYIEDEYAKVATSLAVDRIPTQWDFEYSLTKAVDVAIEFDGRWQRVGNRWELYTIGSPYVAVVRTTGQLTIQQGQLDTPTILVDSGVTRVAMVRGWKNVLMWNRDQGLIVVYIKNGKVYYRTYAQQPPDLPAIWEPERAIVELPSPAQNISAFRTNDYRVGIACEHNGKIYWALTERNWAGMAIESHTITAGIDVTVDLIPITYADIYHEHTITAGVSLDVALLWGVAYNSFKSAENDGDTTIIACAEHFLTNLTPGDFEVRDTTNALFSVTAVTYTDDPCIIELTVESLNFSTPGDLTLKFLGSGTTKGEAGQDVDPFEITFTPEGLEYVDVDPPEVEAIWNE